MKLFFHKLKCFIRLFLISHIAFLEGIDHILFEDAKIVSMLLEVEYDDDINRAGLERALKKDD